MTWPLALHLDRDIAQDLGDPIRTAWQIAWEGHALRTQPLAFFNSNAFWPLPDSLAFSDALLGYAPAALLGEGASAALARYNILFLLAAGAVVRGRLPARPGARRGSRRERGSGRGLRLRALPPGHEWAPARGLERGHPARPLPHAAGLPARPARPRGRRLARRGVAALARLHARASSSPTCWACWARSPPWSGSGGGGPRSRGPFFPRPRSGSRPCSSSERSRHAPTCGSPTPMPTRSAAPRWCGATPLRSAAFSPRRRRASFGAARPLRCVSRCARRASSRSSRAR
jgi:hypothetical protein